MHVCLIEPGGVQTEMGKTMFSDHQPSSLLADRFAYGVKFFWDNTHHTLRPAEVAR